LGHYLQRRGAAAEVRIGIALERSLELVIAVLAVLKTGAAYVPLELQNPGARLQQQLADAGVTVLLTETRLQGQLAEQGAKVVRLDEEWAEISKESASGVGSEIRPEQLLYVMYTSGSTGRAKGVMITYGGVSNYLGWMKRQYPLAAGARVLQTSSIGFDVSVRELWWPLLSGAQLVLLRDGEQQDSRRLVEIIAAQEITEVRLVPALLQDFLEEPRVAECRSLRRVFSGGEVLPKQLQEQFFVKLGAELHNTYGPTEVTINATAWACERGDQRAAVPIGRPIANTRVYLLDRNLEPVPIGVVGELYLGGAGVARGYQQQASLTAERFVPDGYSEEGGGRLYRTGDQGRYSAAGEIEFLGRRDQQVKVRGFRIELGEVEAALLSHEQVREAVVVQRAEAGAEQQLVGYVVAEGEVSVSELRAHLGERLPEYMIPKAFVMLEEWPLTVNGKLDRSSLPAPDGGRANLEQELVAPRTPSEKILAAIWSEVLRLVEVGIKDNFFELGGDSILSIQIVARARREQIYLTPRDIFQHPTIEELAALAAASTRAAISEQGEVIGELPLTPIQQWFFVQDLPEMQHYNQAVLLGLRRVLDAELLPPLLLALMTQHDALRLRFRNRSGRWHQLMAAVAEALPVPFAAKDLSAISDEDIGLAVEAEALAQQQSLDLGTGPLLRIVLFDLGPERGQRLLVTIHHLAIDGVSWRILLEDFQRGYEQLQRGETVELGPKTTSYKQWAESLAAYAESDELRSQLGYWEELLGVGVGALPVSREGGRNQVRQLRSVSQRLSVAETSALLQEVPGVYHTQIQEVLLMALAGTIQRWNGAERVLVNVEGHGREALETAAVEVDVTRTVGWFTTIYPVVLEVRSGTGPGQRLKAVKEQLRRVPERGVGYGLLRYLGGQLSGAAEAQISFNYLGQLDQVVSETGWLSAAVEGTGIGRSPKGTRKYLVEVSALVAAGQLQVSWSYSEELHDAIEIERVAQWYVDELRAVLKHCGEAGAGGYSPSDFPLAGLVQEQLDEVVKRYDRIEDLYPLTPMQQGMLFNTLFEPELQRGIEQMRCRLEGVLDASKLKQAWEHVIERHSILRTAFAWQGLHQMLQIVRPKVALPWEQIDWRALPLEEQEERLQTLLEADQQRGFDPSVAPLMRCTLLQLADDVYHFIWSYHHLLLDGWSIPLLLDEVFTFYESYRSGVMAPVARARSYRDYVAWLGQQELSRAETYWRAQLAGFTTPTKLPMLPAGRQTTGAGFAAEHLQLSEEGTMRLQQFGRKQQLTLNTLVQATWALLLSRYSGEDDLVYGATVSGRPAELPGVEQMVGLFINTLPVRTKLDRDLDFVQWLHKLQAQQVEMRQYEYSPLVQVQRWSEVGRQEQLFESNLVFENYPVDLTERDDHDLKILNVSLVDPPHYPLTMLVAPGPQLNLSIEYNRQRFEAHTINRFLSHFGVLLESITVTPDWRVLDVPLPLDEGQDQQFSFFENERPYEQDQFLFEVT
jgi:amino acid adenylation domain-containing protein/non-ribosomal peptide synthase protein (TIGR01720 family)